MRCPGCGKPTPQGSNYCSQECYLKEFERQHPVTVTPPDVTVTKKKRTPHVTVTRALEADVTVTVEEPHACPVCGYRHRPPGFHARRQAAYRKRRAG
jgi:predicted nucleic acid-binding Zn ribbon protein